MRAKSSILLLAAAALFACATTKIVNSWVAPDHHKESVKKILVLGISADTGLRRSYEDAFVKKLDGLGYQAIPGYQWAPDATKLDNAAINARIKEEGVTHVLVTRVVSQKTIETYHAPTVTVYGGYPGYYGGWGSYYSVGYSTVATPGYTTVNDVVTLETNLYDTSRKEDDAIVWTGHSETWMDTPSAGSKIPEVISLLVYKMQAQKVI